MRQAAEVHPAVARLEGDEVGHLDPIRGIGPDQDLGGEADPVLGVDAVRAELPAGAFDELAGSGGVAGRLREVGVVGPAAGQDGAVDRQSRCRPSRR